MIKPIVCSITAILLGGAGVATAATSFDCRALALSSGAVPQGYSGQCASKHFVPAVANDFRVPTDIGFTIDIFGSATRFRDQLYTFQINDFAGQILRNAITPSIFGMDFSPDGSQLYAVTGETSTVLPKWLGVIPQPSGDFAPINQLTGLPANDTINGFTIDPRSGVAYLATSGGSPLRARLHTMDLQTAVATAVGPMTAGTDPFGTVMISLAINCDGALYAHNIADDALYQIDRTTAAPSLISSHGLPANFAQGMDFDNTDGQLYAFMMLDSAENRFGRFDTNTGAFTTLSNNDPAGEFEGAFPGVCGPESLLFQDGFEDQPLANGN